MKIYELENFFEVCESKSFSRAAQKLYISRQSLLRSVNNLEIELNRPLFSRGPLGVQLTEFGELFYEKARSVLNNFEELYALPEEFSRRKSSHLGLGVRGSFRSAYAINVLVNWFRAENPGIDLEIIGYDTNELLQNVQDNRIDLGFSIIPDDITDICVLPIETLDFALLTHEDSRLAKCETVSANMLDGENFIAAGFSRHPIYLFSKFAESCGAKPNILMNTVDLGLLYQKVHSRAVNGVLLQRDAAIGMKVYDDIVSRPFEPPLCLYMGLVYKGGADMTPTKQNFVDFVASRYEEAKNSNEIW